MVWSSLAPKWPILVIFCRTDHQKSNFLLMYGTSFYRRLLRPVYVIFLKTFWWNSNAQTSEIYRYLHCNLKVVFRWPTRSSKSVNLSWNTLYMIYFYSKRFRFAPSFNKFFHSSQNMRTEFEKLICEQPFFHFSTQKYLEILGVKGKFLILSTFSKNQNSSAKVFCTTV